MTLIKSISGIRGTIGGKAGEGLSPLDVVKFTSAFGFWIKNKNTNKKIKIVVGRDARISGSMVKQLVNSTLIGLGIDVIDIDLATTPTTEMIVTKESAAGGIIITASHNPKQWNALKLLNSLGEFITDKDGKEVLEIADNESFVFAEVDDLGIITKNENALDYHIEEILKLKLVDVNAIKKANFKVAVDAVNSVGGIAIPELLKKLGVENVVELYCDANGIFPHNPEPLPENLSGLSKLIKKTKCDLGFVVDPDVDRLAIINEDGSMFGEEYTLVAVSDYILQNKKGNTVSNLSSTRALKDISEKHDAEYFSSAVGEVNVVTKMKEVNAVIGGEGNGGIIYPELHYGRDSLVGIALFLSQLAKFKNKCSDLRNEYPNYFISKNKIQLHDGVNVDEIISKITKLYKNENISTIDGLKIDFQNEWVQLRKSNTEPIIRIYAESDTEENANKLAERFIKEIENQMI
ncbi:MAG: phosphoglucosamine mutase [Bacteroidales bacterium]|nr:phosphoglucosamine mutase [Bacteroidales bacterium]MBN2756022.1 phosphoglucosamine mutase [Bacteroidales bacterium]